MKPWPLAPEGTVVCYCIYDRPVDYPKHVVVRRWFAQPGSLRAEVEPRLADSLEEARAQVPPEASTNVRVEGDDPALIEVWV